MNFEQLEQANILLRKLIDLRLILQKIKMGLTIKVSIDGVYLNQTQMFMSHSEAIKLCEEKIENITASLIKLGVKNEN